MEKEEEDVRSPYFIMPDSDPGWLPLCQPLLDFLKQGPKTNVQINEWRRSRKFTSHQVVQMLAYSENRHLIYHREGKWIIV
jgi:hypothetical protein